MDSEDVPVDVSVLEALIEVRKQQDLVDQFCTRAESMKAKVAAAVYERVVSDYEKRRHALEEQASPLVTRALAEYRKLRALYQTVQGTHDAARLDKEEVEFRHSLGEIEDETRDERLLEPERILQETEEELARLDAQEARFREALPGVDLSAVEPEPVEAPPEVPPEEQTNPMPASAAPYDAALAEEATVFLPEPPRGDEDAADESERPAFSPHLSLAPTPINQSVSRSASQSANPNLTLAEAFYVPASGPISGESNGAGAGAALVSEADSGRSVNYQLSGLTYIGRAEDNQIRILDPGISRRHVLITATPSGYTIRDLKSQNGTYLNGERIDETTLTDGDRITLGEVTLVFRRGGHPEIAAPEPAA